VGPTLAKGLSRASDALSPMYWVSRGNMPLAYGTAALDSYMAADAGNAIYNDISNRTFNANTALNAINLGLVLSPYALAIK